MFASSRSRSALTFVAMTLVVTISTTSCTSMRPVAAVSAPSPPNEYLAIKPGDDVSVEMKDGRRDRFEVKSVEDDALTSDSGQRYARAEMLELKRQHFSHAKTWSLVGAGVFAGFMVYAYLVVSAYSGLLGGG